MNNPKSQDVLKVIRNFEKVLPMANQKEKFDMGETNVCGTVHCIAGWYKIAVSNINQTEGYISFKEGVKELERDLGFFVSSDICDNSELIKWAINNPSIWGNKFGSGMFSSSCAYESTLRPMGAETFKDVVDHWKDVYERLLILEGEQPKEKPLKVVTKYVAVPVSITEQELILS